MLERHRQTLFRQRHNTPWFVARETLTSFQRHQDLSISAALAFYALFALIPMALLMLFLLSQLVFSFDYAIVKLAILTSNLVPKFSQSIMVEVYNISTQRAAWGVLGMMALLWAIIPLARALRSSFYTIGAVAESPSLLRRTLKDMFAVLGILLLLLLFTFSGTMLERVLEFLRPEFVSVRLVSAASSIITITAMLSVFYHIFFPAHVSVRHILLGALLTAVLWLAMRPAFELFLFFNQDYGAMFGGMKNMFIAIGWLYYSFAVFLLGTELIATLRRKEVLMLRGLFGDKALKQSYLDKLMQLFGRHCTLGERIFSQGESGNEMYYIVAGSVTIYMNDKPLRELGSGAYFGEMAVLANTTRTADAIVTSERAQILAISGENIESLLTEEPRMAMSFLREMALRLRENSGIVDAHL
jgi:membrane protein